MRITNPKYRQPDNKGTEMILMPLFADHLNKKLRAKKRYAFDKLLESDRKGRFCKLYKSYWLNRVGKPLKIEFVDM